MDPSIFSANLKKLRQQKSLTQEQVAALLGVSAQTISRWECGTTLPDVTALPELARLYCVTIDDLYQSTPSAYKNLFQRLACEYHNDRTPERFLRADLEYRSMDTHSPEDKRMYGLIHQYMMTYCKEKAAALYDELLSSPADAPKETYWLTRYAKANFLVLTGKAEYAIREQQELAALRPNDPEETCLLIRTLFYARRCEEGYALFLKARNQFPDSANLFSVGGDLCKKLHRHEEALLYWEQATQLDNGFQLAGSRAKAAYFEEIGDFDQARRLRIEMARRLKREGYELEAEAQQERVRAYPTCEI